MEISISKKQNISALDNSEKSPERRTNSVCVTNLVIRSKHFVRQIFKFQLLTRRGGSLVDPLVFQSSSQFIFLPADVWIAPSADCMDFFFSSYRSLQIAKTFFFFLLRGKLIKKRRYVTGSIATWNQNVQKIKKSELTSDLKLC